MLLESKSSAKLVPAQAKRDIAQYFVNILTAGGPDKTFLRALQPLAKNSGGAVPDGQMLLLKLLYTPPARGRQFEAGADGGVPDLTDKAGAKTRASILVETCGFEPPESDPKSVFKLLPRGTDKQGKAIDKAK